MMAYLLGRGLSLPKIELKILHPRTQKLTYKWAHFRLYVKPLSIWNKSKCKCYLAVLRDKVPCLMLWSLPQDGAEKWAWVIAESCSRRGSIHSLRCSPFWLSQTYSSLKNWFNRHRETRRMGSLWKKRRLTDSSCFLYKRVKRRETIKHRTGVSDV